MSAKVDRKVELADLLERLYKRYNWRRYAYPDPLVFLYDYPDLRDREVVALVASSLAFGNVKQIIGSIDRVVGMMGESPYDYLMSVKRAGLRRGLEGFRHRWAGPQDVESMLWGTRGVLRRHGSLEKCFLAGYSGDDADTVPGMTMLAASIVCPQSGPGACLMPDPCRSSACKRLNLFLRWMVRNDRVDPGGWRGVPASKLLIPLDVHMHRFGLLLGMTSRKQADLKAAREITAAMRRLCPEDPVRYDFALTRLGIRRDIDRDEMLEELKTQAAGPGRKGPR